MNKYPKCFIFDLDGVITDTAEYHYLAWAELTESLNLRFDRGMNERLKGVTRIRSFEIILEANGVQREYTLSQKLNIVERKNATYVAMIKNIQPKDVLEGISQLIAAAKEQGILIALASASKNAREVLELLQMTNEFDYIADAGLIQNQKPAGDIFIDCAQKLGCEIETCIGFEDSDAGITAIKNAGMFAVGINVTRESEHSYFPDFHVKSTALLNFDEIIEIFEKNKG